MTMKERLGASLNRVRSVWTLKDKYIKNCTTAKNCTVYNMIETDCKHFKENHAFTTPSPEAIISISYIYNPHTGW